MKKEAHEITKSDIQDLLRQTKSVMGVTQKELAEALGVKFSALVHWTYGHTLPRKDTRIWLYDKLMEFLDRK